jgi:Tfp pilus assembly protein PilF
MFHAYSFPSQALACYAEAERLDPSNPNWPYLRAVVLTNGLEPAEAIPPLQRAVTRNNDSPLPRLRLGEVLSDQGRFQEAEEQFRAVLAVAPDEPRAQLRLAQIEASRQDWRSCLRHLEAASAAPPARKSTCALRLRACEMLEDSDAAQRQQQLLATLPEDPPWPDTILAELVSFEYGLSARLKRAVQLMSEGRAQQAVSLLEDTVQRYPNSASAWDRLGRFLGSLRKFPAAEHSLRRSLELSPTAGEVWFALGLILLEQRKFDEAYTALRSAARLKPTDAETRCKMGLCLAGKGDKEGAAEAYREALRYQPGLREAQEELAKLRP